MATEPKKVLCIHDLSGAGRCSLSVILPVLAVMGLQPIALPTMLLSTHTGGLGQPARLDCEAYGRAALEHYRALGLVPDCIYVGYLGTEALVDLAAEAFRLWPEAVKVVDPVMADGGKPYSGFTPAVIEKVRSLCAAADLILPNLTEARLLLGQDLALPAEPITQEQALDLAAQLTRIAGRVVVTGLPMGKFVGCAGAGDEPFVVRHLHIDRSFPGTGDLFGAIVIGSLLRGNVLSAAADAAAGFVAQAIQHTPRDADTRFGVWFEPLLPRLAPMGEL
ncbi:bifunctional hydroxymethylpyrimidine kinase/phosphomethylpyrimidine kinase [Faecalibacterium sp. An77]|uniref:bifunctional hydroxymethylpyrimidine kinase/phosphomethylpyrimidine kinase n=1 Tax=Faecalibacterium sp. An77 TaxID=1965655 RepID=UPI001FA8E285|nr:bifunctional hydroxymethylpyrimidine kinase/phosphomethylpyrimidine kinase [Faecalibacterium sp. An77]